MTRYFRLLKDLPTAKAGTVYQLLNGKYLASPGNSEDDPMFNIDNLEYGWFVELTFDDLTGWIPRRNEACYMVDGSFNVKVFNYGDTQIDKRLVRQSIVYPTASAAYTELTRTEALAKVKRYIKRNMDFTPDWQNYSQEKHQIIGWDYAKMLPAVSQDVKVNMSQHNLVFMSKRDIDSLIKMFPVELELLLRK